MAQVGLERPFRTEQGALALSRREFVTLLLGAPVAAACARRARPPLPPGVLVDTGMRRGHEALRDRKTLPSGGPSERHRVVVIGAGAAGLSAAWALRRAGIQDVVVVEHCDTVGGTARGDATTALPHPWGAHYIVAPMREQTELVALLAEMKAIEGTAADGTPIVDEALRCREPEERVYYRGRWYDGLYLYAGADAEERRQFNAFRTRIDQFAAMRDAAGRRAFSIPVDQSSTSEELLALDRISFATWLDQQQLRSPRLRWLADYACRDDFCLFAKDTSAWAGIFYFAARQKLGGHLAQSVVTWPDGNGALVAYLAKQVDVRLQTTAIAIEPRTDGVVVQTIGPKGVMSLHAERVICALPQFVARHLIAGLAARGADDPLDYGAWAVANLHLRARPEKRAGDAPPAWDNVLYDSKSLGYVVATHQAGRDTGPSVWTWYYPFCELDSKAARKAIVDAGQAEWAEVALADLERAHPDLRALVERIDVAFWGHGMIRPRVGALWSVGRRRRAQPLDRVHFANTDLSGVALFEEAFSHGNRAAREVAVQLGAASR